LVGRCNTCGRLRELFQLPDRKDINCAKCNADISTLVLLYRRFEIEQRNGEHSADLEAQLVLVLERFLGRSGLGDCGDAPAQFFLWSEAPGRNNHVNCPPRFMPPRFGLVTR
jgi:hypothetical protein